MLPSKERCPYLVVAEMLEQPFTSNSEEIYTQGTYTCTVRTTCTVTVTLAVVQTATVPVTLTTIVTVV